MKSRLAQPAHEARNATQNARSASSMAGRVRVVLMVKLLMIAWVMLVPVARDIDTATYPDVVFALHVIQEFS